MKPRARHDQQPAAFARQYIEELCGVLRNLPFTQLARALEILEEAWVERRQVFLAGNGGSAATASHMANDLRKGLAKRRGQGLRATALSDNIPLLTAIANDESYTEVFASQLAGWAKPGDILIVFSGSGNSENIVRAVEAARQLDMTTVAFLGMGGGRVAGLTDVSVIVPSEDYGPIEDLHMTFDHLITEYLCRGSAKGAPRVKGRARVTVL